MARTSEKEVERADLHHMINVVVVEVVSQLNVRLLNRKSRSVSNPQFASGKRRCGERLNSKDARVSKSSVTRRSLLNRKS